MSRSKTTLNKAEKAYLQRLSHRLVLKHKILPANFDLQDVKRIPNEERACGAFGEVYHGMYGRSHVALKVVRTLASSTSEEKEKKQEVRVPPEILCFHNAQ